MDHTWTSCQSIPSSSRDGTSAHSRGAEPVFAAFVVSRISVPSATRMPTTRKPAFSAPLMARTKAACVNGTGFVNDDHPDRFSADGVRLGRKKIPPWINSIEPRTVWLAFSMLVPRLPCCGNRFRMPRPHSGFRPTNQRRIMPINRAAPPEIARIRSRGRRPTGRRGRAPPGIYRPDRTLPPARRCEGVGQRPFGK